MKKIVAVIIGVTLISCSFKMYLGNAPMPETASVTALSNSSAASEENAQPQTRLWDNDGAIKSGGEDGETALNSEIFDSEQKLGLHIGVLIKSINTGSGRYKQNTISYAESFYDKVFGNGTDGVLLILNLKFRYCYIVTSGRAMVALSKSDCEEIVDSMKENLQKEDYAGAIRVFLSETEDALSLSPLSSVTPNEVQKSTRNAVVADERSKLGLVGVGTAIGVIISVFVVCNTLARYKIRPVSNANVYLEQDTINLTQRSDTMVRTFTSCEHINSSSNSSFGGGGSSHGGGGGSW
jgi:uncharacterized membrane protein YgcG